MVSSLRSVASESAYTVLIGVMMSRVFFLLKSRAPLMIVTLTVTSVHTYRCLYSHNRDTWVYNTGRGVRGIRVEMVRVSYLYTIYII